MHVHLRTHAALCRHGVGHRVQGFAARSTGIFFQIPVGQNLPNLHARRPHFAVVTYRHPDVSFVGWPGLEVFEVFSHSQQNVRLVLSAGLLAPFFARFAVVVGLRNACGELGFLVPFRRAGYGCVGPLHPFLPVGQCQRLVVLVVPQLAGKPEPRRVPAPKN